MGSIYKRGHVWWIKYYSNGRPIRESSESEKQAVAERLLKQKEGAVANGLPAIPRVDRVSFDEIVKDMLNDYKASAKTSIDDVETSFRLHLTPYFGHRRPARITTADIRHHPPADTEGGERDDQPRALPPTARVLARNRRGEAHGQTQDAATRGEQRPHRVLRAGNVRGVRSHLPAPVKPVVTFQYITCKRAGCPGAIPHDFRRPTPSRPPPKKAKCFAAFFP